MVKNIMQHTRRNILLYILSAVLLLLGIGLLIVFLPVSDRRASQTMVRVEARSCYSVRLPKGDTLLIPIVEQVGMERLTVDDDPWTRVALSALLVSNAGHVLTSDSLVAHAADSLSADETHQRIERQDSVVKREMKTTKSEMKELDYYAHTHSVVDDGYNEVMAHRERLSRHLRRLDSIQGRLSEALQAKHRLVSRLVVDAEVSHAWADDSGHVYVDTLKAMMTSHDAADGLLLLQTARKTLPAHANRLSMNWPGVGKRAVRLMAYADFGGSMARTFPSFLKKDSVMRCSASEGGAWLSANGHLKGLEVGGRIMPLSEVKRFLRRSHALPVWGWINVRGWVTSLFSSADAPQHRVQPHEVECRQLAKDGGVYSGQIVRLRSGHVIRQGYGLWADSLGTHYTGEWRADTLVSGERIDSTTHYKGMFNASLLPHGMGWIVTADGEWYEGDWKNGKREGHGYSLRPKTIVRCGSWRNNRFLGERMVYTSDRVYGIDISRYQHEDPRYRRKVYPIHWDKLRITSLGSGRRVSGTVDYPVSFVYIKATQGIRIRNRFYAADLRQARSHGIPVGSYHFFSSRSNGTQQAAWFLRVASVAPHDLPPVLDLEPTEAEVARMGGEAVLFREVLKWLRIVEAEKGKRPVLYVGQQFVNKHLVNAPEELRRYDVWIARYGEFKPYVHLLHWQLTPYGRVRGIHGEVDINVFNGTKSQFRDYLQQRH